LRPFIADHRALLLADDAELVLDRDASGLLSPEVWQIAFNRVVAGRAGAGERYLFTIGHGNLISFGRRAGAASTPTRHPTSMAPRPSSGSLLIWG